MVQQERHLRMTRQRKVILEELCKVKTHPTADQVYEMVRKKLPKISLATVYRNLDVLCETGVVQKLEVGGTQRRFDGDVSKHYHIRCVACGKVADVMMEPLNLPEVSSGAAEGFDVLDHRLEFMGICEECKAQGQGTFR